MLSEWNGKCASAQFTHLACSMSGAMQLRRSRSRKHAANLMTSASACPHGLLHDREYCAAGMQSERAESANAKCVSPGNSSRTVPDKTRTSTRPEGAPPVVPPALNLPASTKTGFVVCCRNLDITETELHLVRDFATTRPVLSQPRAFSLVWPRRPPMCNSRQRARQPATNGSSNRVGARDAAASRSRQLGRQHAHVAIPHGEHLARGQAAGKRCTHTLFAVHAITPSITCCAQACMHARRFFGIIRPMGGANMFDNILIMWHNLQRQV